MVKNKEYPHLSKEMAEEWGRYAAQWNRDRGSQKVQDLRYLNWLVSFQLKQEELLEEDIARLERKINE